MYIIRLLYYIYRFYNNYIFMFLVPNRNFRMYLFYNLNFSLSYRMFKRLLVKYCFNRSCFLSFLHSIWSFISIK